MVQIPTYLDLLPRGALPFGNAPCLGSALDFWGNCEVGRERTFAFAFAALFAADFSCGLITLLALALANLDLMAAAVVDAVPKAFWKEALTYQSPGLGMLK